MSVRLTLLCTLALALPASAVGVERVSDIVYAERDGVGLLLDAYLPKSEGPHPAIVVVHGGGWRNGSKTQLAVHAWYLARGGFAVFAINYRLSPEHQWPAHIDDCREAVRWVRRSAADFDVDPERIGAFGYSAGAHLVSLLGTVSDPDPSADVPCTVQAVAAGGTPCDFVSQSLDADTFRYLFGGSRRELPEVYELATPLTSVDAEDPPFFFFHGTNDLLVPVDGVAALHAALVEAGVASELFLQKGLGHYTSPIDPRVFRRVRRFFQETLGED